MFQIEGINRVFYGKDFITVSKENNLQWQLVKPEILSVITEHYSRGQPLFIEEIDDNEDGPQNPKTPVDL